jgi:hypothetical protein
MGRLTCECVLDVCVEVALGSEWLHVQHTELTQQVADVVVDGGASADPAPGVVIQADIAQIGCECVHVHVGGLGQRGTVGGGRVGADVILIKGSLDAPQRRIVGVHAAREG